jgi:hypothetical protein
MRVHIRTIAKVAMKNRDVPARVMDVLVDKEAVTQGKFATADLPNELSTHQYKFYT